METLGVFKDLETSARAVDGLIEEGFAEEDITSLTSVPYPDGVLVRTGRRSWFRWFALACAAFGAGAGFLLGAGTAWLYPVQTGDKPIVAYFPVGIITFEVTMLFALIGTVVGMFLEMKLPPWRKLLYDPAIAEGLIGITVKAPSEGKMEHARKIMTEAGALRIVDKADL